MDRTSTVRLTYVWNVPWASISGESEDRTPEWYANASRESLADMIHDGGVDLDRGFVRAEVVDEKGDLTIVTA